MLCKPSEVSFRTMTMGMSNKLESGVFLRKFIKNFIIITHVAILLITSLSEFLKSVRMTKDSSNLNYQLLTVDKMWMYYH